MRRKFVCKRTNKWRGKEGGGGRGRELRVSAKEEGKRGTWEGNEYLMAESFGRTGVVGTGTTAAKVIVAFLG